jgi:hypothetical protein
VSRFKAAFVFGALACAAMAQDLAPEIILLSRIKDHMQSELAALPNYTCLETVTRFHKDSARGAKLQALDTVRLEIVYTDHHEWYGSPGDRSLTETDPVSFIGAGMIANGIFGITLHNLFVADVATFTPQGEDRIAGRAAVRYAFRLPRMFNHFSVSIPGGTGTVGEEGSFWADPQTLDLLRLDVQVVEIPPYLPLASAEFKVNYARTRIAESDVLLPQWADLHMIHNARMEDYDRFDFTYCRSFQTHSALRFDTSAVDSAEAPTEAVSRSIVPSEPEASIPALLLVTVQLATPITDKDPVGKLIEGSVVGDVRRKGKIVIENGAPVRGRIRRLERHANNSRFIVGLEFTEVQAQGVPTRFFADLLRIEKRKGVQPSIIELVRLPNETVDNTKLELPELPGVASFFVDGKAFTLPAGFRTYWRTRGMLRGVR